MTNANLAGCHVSGKWTRGHGIRLASRLTLTTTTTATGTMIAFRSIVMHAFRM